MGRGRDRSRTKGRLTPRGVVADFLRVLPDDAATVLEQMIDSCPPLDLPSVLSTTADSELTASLRMTHPKTTADLFGQLGIANSAGRPRSIPVMRQRLVHAVGRGDQSGLILLHRMTDPTYMLLLVRAAKIDVPAERYEADVDTPQQRALAIAVASRLADPSVPLVLAGMVDEGDEALDLLFDPAGRQTVTQAARTLRGQWHSDWDAPLDEWTRERVLMNPPADVQGAEVAAAAVRTAPRHSRKTLDDAPSPSPSPSPSPTAGHASPAPTATTPPAAATGSVAAPVAAAGAQHSETQPTQTQPAPARTLSSADEVRVLLGGITGDLQDVAAAAQRLTQALSDQAAADDADMKRLVDYNIRLHRAAKQVSDLTGTTHPPSLPALSAALEALDAVDADRQQLERLHDVTGPSAAQAALQALRTELTRLLDSWPPTDPADRSAADSLLALARLIASAADDSVDDEERLAQAMRLMDKLPEGTGKLAASASMGKLTLPESAAPRSQAPPAATAAAVAGELPPGSADSDLTPAVESTSATAGDLATAPAAGQQTATTGTGPASEATGEAAGAPASLASSDGAAAPSGAAPTERPGSAAAATADTTPPSPAPPTTPAAAPQPPVRLAVASARSAVPAPAQAPKPPVEPLPVSGDLASAVATLLRDERLGLAHHMLRTASAIEHSDAVAFAALASELRGASGPCALEIHERLEVTADEDVVRDNTCALLYTAALVTTALLTGSPDAGRLLQQMPEHLDPAWAKLSKLAADAAANGALSRPALTAASDLIQQSSEISEAAAVVADRLGTEPRVRGHRSGALITALRASEHRLGQALQAAAANDHSAAAATADTLSRMDRNAIRDAVLQLERITRAGTGKGLPSGTVNEIVDVLHADRTAAARWAEIAAKPTDGQSQDWSTERLVELSSYLVEHCGDLRAALHVYRSRGNILTDAACDVAEAQLGRLEQIVNGVAQTGAERGPWRVLDLELLKIPAVTYDPSSNQVNYDPVEVTLTELLQVAAEPDFTAALQRRLDADDFAAALRCAQTIDPAAERRVQSLRDVRAQELRSQLEALQLLLVQARNSTSALVEQDALDAQLSQTELMLQGDDVDLSAVSALVADVRERMGSLREETAAELRSRLDKLTLPAEETSRLVQCIANGKYDQVDDELSYLEKNDDLPSYEQPADLAEFYPHVVKAAHAGITPGLLDALAAGDASLLTGVTFDASGERLSDIAAALGGWAKMPAHMRGSFNVTEVRDLLLPALRLAGFEVSTARLSKLDHTWAWARGRRFLELTDARPQGHALIPAFGSKAAGRYRLLLAWEKPRVEDLNDWRGLDGSSAPLIICYFGTLSADERLQLTQEWSDPTHRPTVVLDDAALLYAASKREPFSTLMRITMPFTSAAPFSAVKDPNVPIEMFYGRDRDMREILDLSGPSIIYGGRGMGKSALLSIIQRRSSEGLLDNVKVAWVELERSQEFDTPEVIWEKLSQELERQDVTSTTRGFAQTRGQNRLERLVTEWLDANPDSRILLLVDEADAFFAADARREFRETSRLFTMVNKNSRCKVVFAGLHGVAHHHGVGNNPFSPSGALPIGPLERRNAYRLLTRPLQTLGYDLQPDEANFILMQCSNQPYLIQLFADRLLDRLLRSRKRTVTAPPWQIDRADVEAISADPELRERIHRAFKITLDLDARFAVVVNLIALHAHTHGPNNPLTEAELYDGCRQTWPEGFQSTQLAGFRELLNELEGLGILGRPDLKRGGRTLRSSAVLQSLGRRDEIELTLKEVGERALPESDARLQYRPAVATDGRPGPLSSAQIADLAGRKGDRTRVVVGTSAMCLDRVVGSLQDPVNKPVLRDIRVTTEAGSYRELLKTGADGQVRLTVVSELWRRTERASTCERALQQAEEQLFPEDPDRSRAVVLVAGPSNVEWLQQLTSRENADELVVPLERFSHRNLPLHWRDSKFEKLDNKETVERIMEVTGGWPLLIDELVRRAHGSSALAALDEISAEQDAPGWGRTWLEQTAVLLDGVEEMTALVRLLEDLGDPCTPEDLMMLGGDLDPSVLTLATWFGIVDRQVDGKVALAPLMGKAWRDYSQPSP
jgi:hypothetical protein